MEDAFAPYPIFLDLRKRLAVVIGGSKAAERKAHVLWKHGADVVVLAPAPSIELVQAESEGYLTIERRGYQSGDLDHALIVACVDCDDEVREAVIVEAEERACLLSIADSGEKSNFSTPSVVRRGLLQLAVSTGGSSPVVAKQVRSMLNEEFGSEWADYVSLMARLRALLDARMSQAEARELLEHIAASDVLERIRGGSVPDAEQLIAEFAPTPTPVSPGESMSPGETRPSAEEAAE